jgi:hypothetical protein
MKKGQELTVDVIEAVEAEIHANILKIFPEADLEYQIEFGEEILDDIVAARSVVFSDPRECYESFLPDVCEGKQWLHPKHIRKIKEDKKLYDAEILNS